MTSPLIGEDISVKEEIRVERSDRYDSVSVRALIAERNRMRKEIAEINECWRGMISEIERAIALLREQERPPWGSAKRLLLDLLDEAGDAGLNATIAEQMAKLRGADLKRATAASDLSRLKANGVVEHDGHRYRLRS